MTRLLRFVGLFILAQMLILGAVVQVSTVIERTNPAQPILALDSCAQPCWEGLRPGTTTLDEAWRLLISDRQNARDVADAQPVGYGAGERQLCWTLTADPTWKGCALRNSGGPGPITEVILIAPHTQSFTLGEAIVALGRPVAAQFCRRLGFIYVTIFFANNLEVRVLQNHLERDGAYDVSMPVYQVVYHYPAGEPPYAFDTPPWHGFIYFREVPIC